MSRRKQSTKGSTRTPEPPPGSLHEKSRSSEAHRKDGQSCGRLEKFLLLSSLLTAAFVWSCSPMQGFDIWWHLKTGQLILDQKTLPFVDWYTYSDAGAAWIDLHWGFQLLAVAAYRVGGVAALVLGKAALITAAVVIGVSATRRNGVPWIHVGVWGLVAVVVTGRGIVRPEILSLVFLAAWLWIILRVHDRPRLLWCLPALLVLWVNCHALFVFGIVIFGAWLVDVGMRHVAAGRWGMAALPHDSINSDSTSVSTQQIIIVGCMLVVACLMNPYFEEGALFPLVLFRKLSIDEAFYSARVDEFTSPATFFQEIGLRSLHLDAAALLWLLAASSFLWLARYRSVSPLRLLLFVAFSYLGWKMIRNLSPAAIVCGVVLCENLAEMRGRRLNVASKTSSNGSSGSSVSPSRAMDRRISWIMSLVLLGLAAAHLTGHWGRLTGLRDRFGVGEAPAWYAHEASKFAGQPGFPNRAIVASFGQSAVYEFHNAPGHRVLMDGRLEVCTRETFELYEAVLSRMAMRDPAWQQLIGPPDEHGRLPAIILDSRSARAEINGLSGMPEWRLVFADAAAAVFITSDLADQLGLRVADPTPLMHPPDVGN
jgi:hypothetical protein